MLAAVLAAMLSEISGYAVFVLLPHRENKDWWETWCTSQALQFVRECCFYSCSVSFFQFVWLKCSIQVFLVAVFHLLKWYSRALDRFFYKFFSTLKWLLCTRWKISKYFFHLCSWSYSTFPLAFRMLSLTATRAHPHPKEVGLRKKYLTRCFPKNLPL